jgi:hypothetical protein
VCDTLEKIVTTGPRERGTGVSPVAVVITDVKGVVHPRARRPCHTLIRSAGNFSALENVGDDRVGSGAVEFGFGSKDKTMA